jgi:TolB-like protein/class 3 adenylate cyclase
LTGERVERRLAAVLAADVAGYSRLMGADEEGTLARLKAVRKALVDPAIASHRGRIVKTTGDGMLVEFASAVDAVRGAIEVQRGIAEQNTSVSQDERIELRIGIHVGDIIIDDDDIFGDGVNIAARLEGIAEPGGVCLSDDAYRQVRGKVEIACDDMGPQFLKNIAEPIQAWRARLTGQGSSAPQSRWALIEPQALPLPEKPSIAVLPFQNMSGDPEQEYFADGMVEEITTALSRSHWLFVIARNSAFTYKSKAIDIKRVGRELGVRYVLEGSVRRSADRVRITGQLIEVSSQTHLWADRFDGRVDDIFDLQDKIASSVIGAIVPNIEKAEIALAVRKPTENLSAYDCYLRGLSSFYQFTRDGHRTALPLFARAAELDPTFALAYAGQAGWYITGKAYAWIEGDSAESRQAEIVAREALRLSSDDPRVLAHAGQALTYVAMKVDEGAAILSRAAEIDPNLAVARLWLGGANIFQGKFEDAIRQLELALRLSPLDPRTFLSYSGLASAHFHLSRYDEALEWASDGIRRWPNFVQLHRQMMAALAMLGRYEEAALSRGNVLRLNPTLTIGEFRRTTGLVRKDDIEKVVSAWRLAGMPE